MTYTDEASEQRYDLRHYLDLAAKPDVAAEFDRAFYSGALLSLGDALGAHDYFDHAPELELIYHLRNGVAHGNRFKITPAGRQRLEKHPAHDRLLWLRMPVPHEVTRPLEGREVLFGFIGRAELERLLVCVGSYLTNMGNGDSPRP